MKRVAIVEYMMSAGGVERVLRGLARALLELPEAREWDITLLLARYNSAHRRCEWPTELTGPNLRVEWLGEHSAPSRFLDPLAHAQGVGGLGFTRIPGWVAARALRKVGPRGWRAWLGDPGALITAAASRFDLMYFTYPVVLSAPDVGIPVVSTPQDFNFKHFAGASSPLRRIHERATRSWLDRSARLLLSSGAVQQELLQFYPEYADKAQVVRLGIDAAGAAPAPDEIARVRAARGLPPNFVLVAGWVIPHKNQLAVVEAVAALRARGHALPIVFVGPNATDLGDETDSVRRSPYASEVRTAMKRHGLVAGRDFHALGYVSDAELQCIYRLATVVAVPSLYEGFGLPGLEAMRAGCPVVYASIPPLEEQNQLLGGIIRTFDPKEPNALAAQLEWILTHRADATAAAEVAARRVPEVYDWRKTARGYLDAFERVLSAPRA
jgi:glycosyltransferase involved in cell wall biosynthesis